MPTEPLPFMLDRDAAIARAKPLIDVASPLLREIVNDGTHVFRRCEATAGRTDEYSEHALGALLLYYHVIEATDGIEILLSNGNGNSALPTLRSSFEATLQLQYIAEGDARQRGLQWYVGHVHDRLKAIERFDPNTGSGANLEPVLAGALPDVNIPVMLKTHADESKVQADAMRNLLADPKVAAIEAEYLACQRGNRPVPFYSLFGGPSNLWELAEQTGWRPAYELLYRPLSEVSHARDLRRFYGPVEGDHLGFAPLRDPMQMHQCATYSSVFALHAKRQLLGIFRPDENIRSWYEREILPLSQRLRQMTPRVDPGRDAE